MSAGSRRFECNIIFPNFFYSSFSTLYFIILQRRIHYFGISVLLVLVCSSWKLASSSDVTSSTPLQPHHRYRRPHPSLSQQQQVLTCALQKPHVRIRNLNAALSHCQWQPIKWARVCFLGWITSLRQWDIRVLRHWAFVNSQLSQTRIGNLRIWRSDDINHAKTLCLLQSRKSHLQDQDLSHRYLHTP